MPLMNQTNRFNGLKWFPHQIHVSQRVPSLQRGRSLHSAPPHNLRGLRGGQVGRGGGWPGDQVTCLMSTWLSTCFSTARPSSPSSLATPAISQCWSVARRSWTRWRGTSRSALAEFNTRLHKSMRTVEKSFDQVKCFNKRPEEHCVWMKAFVENCTKGILGKCSEAGFS